MPHGRNLCLQLEGSRDLKSVNLQYNTLVRWAVGTNQLLTKRLRFQVFFFSKLPIDVGTENS